MRCGMQPSVNHNVPLISSSCPMKRTPSMACRPTYLQQASVQEEARLGVPNDQTIILRILRIPRTVLQRIRAAVGYLEAFTITLMSFLIGISCPLPAFVLVLKWGVCMYHQEAIRAKTLDKYVLGLLEKERLDSTTIPDLQPSRPHILLCIFYSIIRPVLECAADRSKFKNKYHRGIVFGSKLHITCLECRHTWYRSSHTSD